MIRAVVLDFDGVILDSVGIKTNAFARLFEDRGPAIAKQAVDYHLAHGGISRFRKFEHIYANFLREPLSEAESNRLGQRFTALAFDEVSKASWIPGAEEFLRDYCKTYLLFVASGTPEEELRQIVHLRDLDTCFVNAFGSPATKTSILARIAAEHRLQSTEIVFVGDTMTDFQAAKESEVEFIGIASAGTSPFPESTTVIMDLRQLAATIEAL